MASLINIAPSSYIMGSLSSTSARNNNKGGGGYNTTKGGLISY
jgi:hypothetical protein